MRHPHANGARILTLGSGEDLLAVEEGVVQRVRLALPRVAQDGEDLTLGLRTDPQMVGEVVSGFKLGGKRIKN